MERFVKVSVPITGEDEAAAAREVILSGEFVSGRRVREFEQGFAAYIGSAHACAVNSCTAALHIALAVLGIRPGDEVVVPPLTFMSTITSVIHQGATPIFADIDPDSFCMDPAQLEKVVGPRTKAVIPVHYLGNACEMDGILDVAKRKGLFVIEDCAQAHGTEYKGRRVGSIGDIGCFSFYATKHMTTGEGGMLTSDNAEWMDLARKIRSHGLVNRDDHEYLGYNYRMTEMEAAIGLVQLAKLERFNEQRIRNCEYILGRLAEYRAAHPDAWFSLPVLSPHVRHTYFWCPIIINVEQGIDPTEVVAKLRERGVEVRQRYKEPLSRQKVMEHVADNPRNHPPDYKALSLPACERVAGRIIGLPNHPRLTREEMDFVVDTVAGLY
ncbi:MAG: DegT/DnrJ/EryC1/StrS family aminotransferase [Desulfovibrionaceae bacterium]